MVTACNPRAGSEGQGGREHSIEAGPGAKLGAGGQGWGKCVPRV
jgi:hypothetical protein